jgi:hypothetical protein
MSCVSYEECEDYPYCADCEYCEEEDPQESVISLVKESLKELRFISSFISSIQDEAKYMAGTVRAQRFEEQVNREALVKLRLKAENKHRIEKLKQKAEKMIADGQPLSLHCAAVMLEITDAKLRKMRLDGTIKDFKSESGSLKISLEEINRVKEHRF